jgi:hypothetical protein
MLNGPTSLRFLFCLSHWRVVGSPWGQNRQKGRNKGLDMPFAGNIQENAGLNYHATQSSVPINDQHWKRGNVGLSSWKDQKATPGYPLYNLTPGAEVPEMWVRLQWNPFFCSTIYSISYAQGFGIWICCLDLLWLCCSNFWEKKVPVKNGTGREIMPAKLWHCDEPWFKTFLIQLIREDFLRKVFSGRWLAKKLASSAPVFASKRGKFVEKFHVKISFRPELCWKRGRSGRYSKRVWSKRYCSVQVRGQVSSIVPFGVFVDIGAEKDGWDLSTDPLPLSQKLTVSVLCRILAPTENY